MIDYRLLTLITLGAVVALLALHWIATARRAATPGERPRLRLGERVLYTLLLLATVAQVLTSIEATLGEDPRMHGQELILHTSAGMALATVLALLMLLWAERHAGRSLIPTAIAAPVPRFSKGQCWAFWLLAIAGFGSTLTVMLMMLPAFSEAGEVWLLAAHRYFALALVALVLVHAYLMLRARASRVQARAQTPEPAADQG